MVRKLVRSLKYHDHWYAEWWSAVLLIAVGIYGFFEPESFIIQQSFVDGFLRVLPKNLWEILFIFIGLFQTFSLFRESLFLRAISAFFASSLLIWGCLNIFVYGQWHFSLIAWGIFVSVNLYALIRILRGVEVSYEYH